MALSFTHAAITLDAAEAILARAMARSRAMGLRLAIAICDPAGHLVALRRDDGTWPPSIDVAKDKAATSAIFGLSTDDLGAALSYSPALHQGLSQRPGVVLFGGGLPILLGEAVIGGIGASGASEQEERACLTYALEHWTDYA
ncbi:MAG TPA: heme-binding protein [Novosphingobium sp.]|nr:heme-binding protein [Novosphingobium sp.]HZV09903.1 heme-binding protein [Novosphingobium sp.]